jgi:hypothetical protein
MCRSRIRFAAALRRNTAKIRCKQSTALYIERGYVVNGRDGPGTIDGFFFSRLVPIFTISPFNRSWGLCLMRIIQSGTLRDCPLTGTDGRVNPLPHWNPRPTRESSDLSHKLHPFSI